MAPTLQELRALLRKDSPKLAGVDGEKYAENWLDKSGWKYEKIEQGKTTMSKELKDFGGKRPDFIADTGDEKTYVLIDAKYHSTEDCTTFKLQDDEIAKYRNLKSFTENKFPENDVEVLFMVIPKEHNGKRLVWVELSEFDDGDDATTLGGKPATQIGLKNRDKLWFDIK